MPPAASSGGCNTLGEDLLRCAPCEGGHRTSIELRSRRPDLLFGECGEVGRPGKVLSKEPGQILNRWALPGASRAKPWIGKERVGSASHETMERTSLVIKAAQK